jgi:hypothetical protein
MVDEDDISVDIADPFKTIFDTADETESPEVVPTVATGLQVSQV